MAESLKEHHFFLFRHCVRTASVHIHHLNDENETTKSLSNNPSDYFAATLPDWNVPEFHCTEGGMDLVKNTGSWLLQHKNGIAVSGEKKVQFELISDKTQRDIDTSFRLLLGIEKAAGKYSYESQNNLLNGIHHVSFAPWLFDEFGNGICTQEYSNEDMEAAVMERLGAISPPYPPASDMLVRLQEILGDGKMPLNSIPVESKLTSDKRDFQGAPAFLLHMAQVFFYSRASGISFAPEATNKDIYKLLQWQHYTRSVLNIETPEYAYRGAILSNAMINVLRDGYFQKQKQHGEDSYDARVTIVAGHDVDLDGLATALGAHWDLGEPYISGRHGTSYLPTPPMSGLHARRNLKNGHISLSFMYPVYSNPDSESWQRNSSGILESTPLLFKEHEVYSSQDGTATFLEYHDALDRLERHIQKTLMRYKGAASCYSSSEMFRTSLQPNHIVSVSDKKCMSLGTAAEIGFFVGTAVVGLIATIVSCLIISWRRKKLASKHIAILQLQEEVEIA